eukprot:6103256-Prymnesium_polylepis.1
MDGLSTTPEQIACFRQNDLLQQHSAHTDDLRRREQRLADERATSEARRALLEAFSNSLPEDGENARRELLRLAREELSLVNKQLQLEEELAEDKAKHSARLLTLQFDIMLPVAVKHGAVLPVACGGIGAADTAPVGTVDSRSVHELALHLADVHPHIPFHEADSRARLVAATEISHASVAAAERATQRTTSASPL